MCRDSIRTYGGLRNNISRFQQRSIPIKSTASRDVPKLTQEDHMWMCTAMRMEATNMQKIYRQRWLCQCQTWGVDVPTRHIWIMPWIRQKTIVPLPANIRVFRGVFFLRRTCTMASEALYNYICSFQTPNFWHREGCVVYNNNVWYSYSGDLCL